LIDIPLNKALVAVEVKKLSCPKCFCYGNDCEVMACCYEDRKDGKNVMFKLVDYKDEQ